MKPERIPFQETNPVSDETATIFYDKSVAGESTARVLEGLRIAYSGLPTEIQKELRDLLKRLFISCREAGR